MIMMGKSIRRAFRLITYIALICLLCAGCGKKQEPVQHVSVVQPLVTETEETAEPATEEAAEPVAEEVAEPVTEETSEPEAGVIAEDGVYTSASDVAEYINTYGKLPGNFITKKEAGKLGWEGGSLEPYAPGMCIGGDYFGNYEGLLPDKPGREYHECDIDTLGKSKRGAKRIIYSNDGLIYYTGDHYESFTLLYGTE